MFLSEYGCTVRQLAKYFDFARPNHTLMIAATERIVIPANEAREFSAVATLSIRLHDC